MPQGVPKKKIDELFVAIRHEWTEDAVAQNRKLYDACLELSSSNDFLVFVTLAMSALLIGRRADAKKWADYAYAFRDFSIPGGINGLADVSLATGNTSAM